MNKVYLLLISTLTLMASCTGSHNRKMYGELAKADSLLMKELPDSAFKELLTIGQPAENDRECKAYHALLVTQARYLLNMRVDSCADIDYAIEYYKATEDKEKLARTLHWKAGLLREAGRYLEAIEAEKGAEANISENTNPMLRIRIYDIMSWLNEQTGNYPQAKEYDFKALHLAEKLKNKERIANAYYNISLTYTGLEKVDSALYHIEKALPFIDYTTLKPYIIFQAALCYRNTEQWDKAEEYVKKGMGIKPGADYEGLLGDIYIQTGRADEGVTILRKILPELSGTDKWQAMQLIEDVMMKQGRHAEAARLQEEITLMKDSIAKEKQTAEALAMQKEYERKTKEDRIREENEKTSWMHYAITGGVGVFVVALIGGIWYRRMKGKHDKEMAEAKKENTKARKRIDEAEKKITENESRISNLKEENDRKAEEIDLLNEKLGKNNMKTAKTIANGNVLYEKICNDENFCITDSNDYADIVEYYRTVKPSFFAEKEKIYDGLTPYNLCILIFKEEAGFDNDRIRHICGISAGTLRTLLSRIKGKKHDESACEQQE